MKLMAPKNFDGDAATDRLGPTWKAQVDLSRLDRPDSQVYFYSARYCQKYRPMLSFGQVCAIGCAWLFIGECCW